MKELLCKVLLHSYTWSTGVDDQMVKPNEQTKKVKDPPTLAYRLKNHK